jgi:hypothetical protein
MLPVLVTAALNDDLTLPPVTARLTLLLGVVRAEKEVLGAEEREDDGEQPPSKGMSRLLDVVNRLKAGVVRDERLKKKNSI